MAQSRDLFARSIRSLLQEHCLKCHGGERTRGGLDLSSRESLLKGGDSGIVVMPGQARASKLYRMTAHLEQPAMPPSGKLGSGQTDALLRWINLGAAYDRPLIERPSRPPGALTVSDDDRAFWSFRPLRRPAVPEVKTTAASRNPIDRFHLARLEARGLAPTPRADRRTLLRRLAFDLTGLPPTPDETAAFLTDGAPDAYERLVDRLLASPAHGERWARHWLDLVRFAESHGFEHDYDRPNAWPYRDYVIQALNRDLPYDDFVRCQLAGDEIAPNDPLALTATGFLGAGVHSTQITAATVEKERYEELDDIVRTMGAAMLGLTIGCARCHDHKSDPIASLDYYRLLSTFTKTVRSDVDVEFDAAASQRARRQHQADLARLEDEMARYERDVLPGRVAAWRKARKQGEGLSAWAVVTPISSHSAGGATFVPQPDGSLLATGINPARDTYTFVVRTTARPITAIRLEALSHPSLVGGGPGRAGNGNFALSDVKITAAPLAGGPAEAIALTGARATFEQRGLPVAAALDASPTSGWAVDPQFGKDHAAIFDLARPLDRPGGIVLTITLRFNTNTGHNIGVPRLSLATTPTPPVVAGEGIPAEVRDALAALDADPSARLDARQEAALLRWHRGSDTGWRRLHERYEALRKKGPTLATVKAMICSEGLPAIRLHSQGSDYLEQTHVLRRGDPNQKGAVATQSFPRVLMRAPEGERRWQETPPPGSRTPYQRRSLANWIVDVEYGAGHLLARVIVNRLWQHHFGRGLVATASDFGLQGERPSHPELLDWLASELIAHGWRLRPIQRLIVTSAAYRQGTTFDAGKSAVDPDNRLLWRRTPRRLDAEVLRDALLAVSGQLDRRMFGPGERDPGQQRRAIYFFVKRSQLVPMLVLFDAPDGTVSVEGRTSTTIAPQALLMMNNPLVRGAAAALAGRIGTVAAEQESIRTGYALAVARAPQPAELAEALTFLREQRAAYAEAQRPDAGRRALADLCQVLLGLNEFLYID